MYTTQRGAFILGGASLEHNMPREFLDCGFVYSVKWQVQEAADALLIMPQMSIRSLIIRGISCYDTQLKITMQIIIIQPSASTIRFQGGHRPSISSCHGRRDSYE